MAPYYQELIKKTERELKIRNYSRKTISSYIFCLKKYFNFKKVKLSYLDTDNIKDFLLKKQMKDTLAKRSTYTSMLLNFSIEKLRILLEKSI